MALTGYATGNMTQVTTLAAEQMPDIDRYLYLLEPYQTPILQWLYFSQGMNKAQVVTNADGYFQWFEDELVAHQTTLTGAGIAGGASPNTNISVTDKTWINEGDILLVEATGQMVYVSSVAEGEIDITHIDGSSAITAATTGYIKKIGSRNNEFNGLRTGVFTKPVAKNNYCTISTETVTTSGRYQAADFYTNGMTHKEQVNKKTLEMKFQFERQFLFSTASGAVTDSSAYRFTYGKGFLGFVTTNSVSFDNVLTEEKFDQFLMQCFSAKGSSRKKRLYAGMTLISRINSFIKSSDKYRVDSVAYEYGIKIDKYFTPFGLVEIVWDPVMDGKFADYGFLVDEKGIKLRYMANDEKGSRKFRIEPGVETPGTDGMTSKLLADIGIQVYNEETHGILYNSAA